MYRVAKQENMGLFDPIYLNDEMKQFLVSLHILQDTNEIIKEVRYFKVWNEFLQSGCYTHPEYFYMMIKLPPTVQALFKIQNNEIKYSDLRKILMQFVLSR